MPAKGYVPLTRKINTIVIIILFLGIGGIIVYFSSDTIITMNDSIERNLEQQAGILSEAIENFMIPGEANLAVEFFQDLGDDADLVIKLFRANQELAFQDEETLIAVNNNQDFKVFDPTARLTNNEPPLAENPELEASFERSLQRNPTGELNAFISREADNNYYYRAYVPLLNRPRCTTCHSGNHTFRGVIDIRSDITSVVRKQTLIPAYSSGILVIVVILLAVVIFLFFRYTLIRPILTIGSVCTRVTEGNFDQKVFISNNDEIGQLGDTVNQMVEGLHERYELSKYVSSSTVKALRQDQRGQRHPVTMLFSDIRSFTSYSESHSPETVVEFLNKLLSFQTEIIQENQGDVDKYVGDEIVAIFLEEQAELAACRAALLIQQELTRNSRELYDNLTVGIGLHCGEVIKGMIGSQKRADFTVIGDNVNLTARLCQVAKPGQILISENMYEKVQERVKVKGPYRIKVKGKAEDLHVYLLHGLKGSAK